MSDVFLSYATEDRERVRPLVKALEAAGLSVWWDRDIRAGAAYDRVIEAALADAKCVVVAWSNDSVESEYVRSEVEDAANHDILIPVLIDDVRPPLAHRRRQAVNLVAWNGKQDEEFGKLISGVRATISVPAAAEDASPQATISTGRWRIRWLTGVAVALVIAVVFGAWIASRATGGAPALDRSVAVMPFSMIGGDAQMNTYAGALTEELRTDVAGYQELRSVAVEDATNIRDISDASYVVAGNVQRLGDSVRVGASMTRTDDHQTVWAKTFERAADATGDPTEMASTLGRFIRQNLVQDQQCESVRRSSRSEQAAAAYCAALAERARYSQGGDLDDALELRNAQRAIALDPNIADAYRIAAYNYTEQGGTGLMEWHEAARDARETLDRGLALAPNDPKLLTAQGQLESYLELDGPSAAASFRASLASDPLQPYAYQSYAELAVLATAQGNLSDAAENYRRALRIYDADAGVYLGYGAVLRFSGQNRDAIRAADAGLRLVQSGWLRAYLLLDKAYAYDALGMTAEANKAIDDALSSAGPMYRPLFAGILAQVGRRDEANQILAHLERLEHPPIDAMVFAYAALGDDRVFEWIRTAIDDHVWIVVGTLRANPLFSELRKDPRWAEVMKHLESEEAKGRAGQRNTTPEV
jgi:TolB-like protein/Tfp pilus assembly protein PilF